MFIDTHAHLYLAEFDEDRDSTIERAVRNGIERILLPNIDSTSILSMNRLAGDYPGVCFAMMGLHPTSVNKNYSQELECILNEFGNRKYIAIGEIGIDLYWDKSHFKEQCVVFRAQLDLAIKSGLPVVIHARESFKEILDVLNGYKNKGIKGVFHAFTGDIGIAEQVIALGFKLGIGGIVTYKNSTLPDVVAGIALENIVLETDSPYLTPVPYRGKRNESSYIPNIAHKIALIKNIPLADVAEITTRNALEIFFNENGHQ